MSDSSWWRAWAAMAFAVACALASAKEWTLFCVSVSLGIVVSGRVRGKNPNA